MARRSFMFFLIVMLASTASKAQDTLSLYDNVPMDHGPAPHLITRLAPPATATGSAVMICPGGGYAHLAMDHEGKQIAQWFNSLGIHAFILQYRLGTADGSGYKHPDMLNDAQRGMRMIRANAAAWGVDPNRIAVMGFSAGGHLASSLGTHFDAGDKNASDPVEKMSCRPDLMILCYPVISLNQPWTHTGSKITSWDPIRTLLWWHRYPMKRKSRQKHLRHFFFTRMKTPGCRQKTVCISIWHYARPGCLLKCTSISQAGMGWASHHRTRYSAPGKKDYGIG